MNDVTFHKLTPDQITEKANEILEVMRVWEISRIDAISISRTMAVIASRMSDNSWKNPLEGTGLKYVRDINTSGNGKGIS